jgi:hypothetical protein
MFIYEIISFVTFIINIIEHITKNLATSFYVFLVRKLQNTVLDLQCRSMKNNIIFTNLFEQRTENVEEKLRAFILLTVISLELDTASFVFPLLHLETAREYRKGCF